jgi:hypothetical protein
MSIIAFCKAWRGPSNVGSILRHSFSALFLLFLSFSFVTLASFLAQTGAGFDFWV